MTSCAKAPYFHLKLEKFFVCFYHCMCLKLIALMKGSIRWQLSYECHCSQELLKEDKECQLKQQKIETTTDMRGVQKIPTFE